MSRHDKVFIDHEEQTENIQDLMELIRSEHGEEEIQALRGGATRWDDEDVIPSGSLSLDMSIGIGGWPRGRMIEIFGPESSGKTTMALHAVRSAQRQGLTVAYIDAEHALDPNYMMKLGIDLEKVIFSQPTYLEKGIDIMNTAIESGNVGLLVVDSIPALKARDVYEAEADKETRALEARRWSAQLPKIISNAKKYKSTIMMINQERDSMNMYGAPISTPGGRAIKFGASIRVQLKKYIEGKQNDGMDYQVVSANLIKNKVGPPFKKAVFYLNPPRPIDWVEDTIISAIDFGVVKKDMRLEIDGIFTEKKQWFSMDFSESDLELMKEDDEEAVEEALDKERIFALTDSDKEGMFGLEVYQRKNFDEFIERFPSLIETIEERVLDRLNDDDVDDILSLDGNSSDDDDE